MTGTRSEFGANRDRDLVLLRLSGSNGGGGGSVTLLSGAEHECLVQTIIPATISNAVNIVSNDTHCRRRTVSASAAANLVCNCC